MQEATITVTATPRMRGICAAAKRCGVSRIHLAYIMRGQRNPSAKLRAKLRRIGVTKRLDGSEI